MTPDDSDGPDGPRRGEPPGLPEPGSPGALIWLPFSPGLWARAGRRPLWPTLAVVYLYTALASVLTGFGAGSTATHKLKELADIYDKRWSPVVISADGEARVEGDRPPRRPVEDVLVAVDIDAELVGKLSPENQGFDRYVMIRKQETVYRTNGTSQTIANSELIGGLAKAFDLEEIRVDGKSIMGFLERHGRRLRLIALFGLGGGLTLVGWVTALVYAAGAALFVHSLAGRIRGMDYGTCFKIALAAVTGKIMIGLAIGPIVAPHLLFPLFLAVVTCLATLAVTRTPFPSDKAL